jgi:hypothetical protein
MDAPETLVTISSALSICWVMFNIISLWMGANGLDVFRNIDSTLSITPSQPVQVECQPIVCGNHVYYSLSQSECKYDIDFLYCFENRATLGVVH